MSSDGFLWIRAMIFLFSVVCVGFFSGSETAFMSSDRWVIDKLSREGHRKARVLQDLIAKSSDTLSALLIGTNVFTVLASVAASSVALSLGLQGGPGLAVLSLGTGAVLFMFSELVPKLYASLAPTRMALEVAVSLSVITKILKPISEVILLIPKILSLVAGKNHQDEVKRGSDGPIRAALDIAEEGGLVDPDQTEVMYGVLDSSDKTAADVMVPIERAHVLSADTTLGEALDDFRHSGFSRVPLLWRDKKLVLGVVYIKDVVSEMIKNPQGGTKLCASIARKPFIASCDDNVLDLLAKMRKGKVHMAIVVKDGTPCGILTMEDLIEEILGDIPEDTENKRATLLRVNDAF